MPSTSIPLLELSLLEHTHEYCDHYPEPTQQNLIYQANQNIALHFFQTRIPAEIKYSILHYIPMVTHGKKVSETFFSRLFALSQSEVIANLGLPEAMTIHQMSYAIASSHCPNSVVSLFSNPKTKLSLRPDLSVKRAGKGNDQLTKVKRIEAAQHLMEYEFPSPLTHTNPRQAVLKTTTNQTSSPPPSIINTWIMTKAARLSEIPTELEQLKALKSITPSLLNISVAP
jgi:hypothetical protein